VRDEKRCSVCRIVKPIAEFNLKADGQPRSHCKKCRKISDHQKRLAGAELRSCQVCGTEEPYLLAWRRDRKYCGPCGKRMANCYRRRPGAQARKRNEVRRNTYNGRREAIEHDYGFARQAIGMTHEQALEWLAKGYKVKFIVEPKYTLEPVWVA
jgi:hypothetical protein